MRLGWLVLALGFAASGALGQEAAQTITLQGHRFAPDTLIVPAGRKVRIVLVNKDPALEEFDSDDLGVEEDVTPNGRTSFTIGPLKPGEYRFMGEHHASTAQGKVVAKPAEGGAGGP